MYKAGKLWVTGAVTVVSMGVGLVTQNMQVSADTTENVPATVANVNYDKEISNQQNTVNYAQKHVDMAQNDVNIAQAEANRADKIAVEATPQKISEIQNTIKNTQAQLENERIQAKNLKINKRLTMLLLKIMIMQRMNTKSPAKKRLVWRESILQHS